jgi:hypothetical protein
MSGSDFPNWSRAVIRAAATGFEAAIPGARRGRERQLRGLMATHVHFTDAHLPQALAIWLFAAEAGAASNVRGYGDAIGVGLMYDAEEELDRGAWKLRPISPFSWRVHIDDRCQGYRWLRSVSELPADAGEAGQQIVARVVATLVRAGAVAPDDA